MANYLFIYHGGTHPSEPEEIKKVMAAWQEWFTDMGERVVDGGNPVGMSSTVHGDKTVSKDGGANPVGGYTVIAANDQQEAEEVAKGCPLLDAGGSVEVAEIHDIKM